MEDLYSPKLTEVIVRSLQWNKNAYTLFANFVTCIPDVDTQNKIASMLSVGFKQNEDIINLLTSTPKDETIQ